LYLYSAELKAFDGIGNFHKVSQHLKQMGITDDFLVSLGVRKSVAIDFLFAHLDTLQWSSDPKPLIEYLRSATLTKQDVNKLRSTQYLPAENDESRMFGPSELYLPSRELRIFPFVKLLQWPSEDDITERSLNGKFLTSLGVNVLPPLLEVLLYMTKESTDEAIRLQCLDFVAKRLGSGGDYASDWNRLSRSDKQKLKFLPCVAISPISGKERRTLFSVLTCCYDGKCAVMGIPVIDTSLGEKAKLYGPLFQCVAEPAPGALLQKLRMLVSEAKKMLVQSQGTDDSTDVSEQVISSFSKIFGYLSGRTSDMSASMLGGLANEDFIPSIVNGRVHWFKPNEVFFKSEDGGDSVTQSLFQVVEFSPFLAAAGVKQEAATKDIFRLMIESPETVLAAAKNEAKYKQFLRRVAAHKPFRRVTPEIRDSPFLLAYSMSKEESKEKTTFELAKAQDVYIIDNSFFARMFPVKRAPHESDLEDFYALIGSKYISKEVKKRYHVVGEARQKSPLTQELVARIQERGPLLVSPSVTSRPLVSNAASIIDDKKLEIVEVPELKAVFSLKKSTRSQKVTCCSTQTKFGKNCLYITKDFDWFDVGYAIGELILERCQLEDAFFISSLLEAPLEQLRARGFPVDRIIHPEPPPEPEPKPEPAVSHAASPIGATGPNGKMVAASGGTGVSTTESAPTPPSRGEEKQKCTQEKKEVQGSLADYIAVLKNIFPGVDEAYLRNRLGEKPTLEAVRDLAEEMTNSGYPKEMKQEIPKPQKEEPRKSKIFGSKKLGRAVNGLMGSGLAGMGSSMSNFGNQHQGVTAGPPPAFGRESNTVKSPEMDALAHHSMEKQLEQRVKQSTNVDGDGISFEDRIQAIPEGMDHDEKCELVPGHDLKPFVNPATGKAEAHNGIKIFFAQKYQDSESYVRSHMDAVESFAVVLERLSDVYGIKLNSVAMYHDSVGNSIAFNANRALYFNLHFFCALHYGENGSANSDCYSYWFVIFAHELAHHFVSAHNRAHAFYTESYCTMYMPKLLTMLSRA